MVLLTNYNSHGLDLTSMDDDCLSRTISNERPYQDFVTCIKVHVFKMGTGSGQLLNSDDIKSESTFIRSQVSYHLGIIQTESTDVPGDDFEFESGWHL